MSIWKTSEKKRGFHFNRLMTVNAKEMIHYQLTLELPDIHGCSKLHKTNEQNGSLGMILLVTIRLVSAAAAEMKNGNKIYGEGHRTTEIPASL